MKAKQGADVQAVQSCDGLTQMCKICVATPLDDFAILLVDFQECKYSFEAYKYSSEIVLYDVGTEGYGNQGSAGQKIASAVPGTQANKEKVRGLIISLVCHACSGYPMQVLGCMLI